MRKNSKNTILKNAILGNKPKIMQESTCGTAAGKIAGNSPGKTPKKAMLLALCMMLCTLMTACGKKNVGDTMKNANDTQTAMQESTTVDSAQAAGTETDPGKAAIEPGTAGEEQAMTAKAKQPAKEGDRITLSGDASDVYTAAKHCYTEGENVVIYFQKGVEIHGDMLILAEQFLTDIEQLTGMDFTLKNGPCELSDTLELYFTPGIFDNVNPDKEKIEILVVTLENGEVEWAFESGVILETADFDYENNYYVAPYHELAHLLQYRNGIMLGSIMDEGYAVYIADRVQRMKKYPNWNTLQYFYPYGFDEGVIAKGEDGFCCRFTGDPDNNYQYGIRFVTFLYETYGEDIYWDIVKEAIAQGYDDSFDFENEEETLIRESECLKKIIKSKTSEKVFNEFADWYNTNWQIEEEKYSAYLQSIGLEY